MTASSIRIRVGTLQCWLICAILGTATVCYAGVHSPTIYAVRVLIFVVSILWILTGLLEGNIFSRFYSGLTIPLFLFAGFLALIFLQHQMGDRVFSASVGTVNRYDTSRNLLQLLFYLFFFLTVARVCACDHYLKQLIMFVALLVFGVALLGAAQRMTGVDRLWPGGKVYGALFGTFINENHFGGLSGLCFPMFLAVMHYHLRRIRTELESRRRDWKYVLLFGTRLMDSGTVFLFILSSFTLACCIFAAARVSSIVILATCAAYFVIHSLTKRRLKFYVALIVLVTLAVLFLHGLGLEKVIPNFSPDFLWSGLTQRLHIAHQAMNVFYDYPWFGTGLGSFPWISSRYVFFLVDQFHWTHAHNDYVELLAETGILGFALCLGSLFILVLIAVSSLRKGTLSLWNQMMVVQSLVAFVNIGVMEFADFHLKIPANALFFITQLGILYANGRGNLGQIKIDEDRKSWGRPRFGRIAAMLPIAAVVLFLMLNSTQEYLAYDDTNCEKPVIEDYERATQRKPRNSALWYNLAWAEISHFKQLPHDSPLKRKFEFRIKTHLRLAVLLSPTYADYWYNTGRVEYAIRYREEALQAFRRAVEWAPQNSRYLLNLMVVLLKESDRSETPAQQQAYLRQSDLLYRRLAYFEQPPTDTLIRQCLKKSDYDRFSIFLTTRQQKQN